jgi:hypothetical protein
VIGNSPIERYWVEQMRVAFRPFATQLSFTWLNELALEDMLNRAATLPARSAIYFSFILADAANVAREEDAVFPALHGVANAPIFSNRDGHFGKGIVGGPLISPDEITGQMEIAFVKRRPVRPFVFCAASLQTTSKSHLSDF